MHDDKVFGKYADANNVFTRYKFNKRILFDIFNAWSYVFYDSKVQNNA